MRHMTQELGSVDSYKIAGFEILEQAIPENYLELARKECYKLKDIRLKEIMLGLHEKEDAEWGQEKRWLGYEMASKHSPDLLSLYRSSLMYDVSRRFLECSTPWLYNDQAIVKTAREMFVFEPHYDNQYSNANERGIQTMNALWILDDQTKENGHLWIEHQSFQVWLPIYPKAGDIVLIDGNTPHASGENITDFPRGCYACVYTSDNMKDPRYYTEPFDSI